MIYLIISTVFASLMLLLWLTKLLEEIWKRKYVEACKTIIIAPLCVVIVAIAWPAILAFGFAGALVWATSPKGTTFGESLAHVIKNG